MKLASDNIPGWNFCQKTNAIQRRFEFENYYQTMAFVNAVAWIAHEMNHHPDLTVTYQACLVSYTTHDAHGVTEKDFCAAKKINRLVSDENIS